MDIGKQRNIVSSYFTPGRLEAERAHLGNLRQQLQEADAQIAELVELQLVLANLVRQPDPGSISLSALHTHHEIGEKLDRLRGKRSKTLQDVLEVEARVVRWGHLQAWGAGR